MHLSPANGEEDIRIAEKRKIPVFCPIDDEVKFTKEAGAYAGMFVRDADMNVAKDLKACGALVALRKIRHKYPLCWRSAHRLVWLARRGWFYKLEKLDQMAVDAANNVEYFYEPPKNRFLAIVGERHPWCISRERYWLQTGVISRLHPALDWLLYGVDLIEIVSIINVAMIMFSLAKKRRNERRNKKIKQS